MKFTKIYDNVIFELEESVFGEYSDFGYHVERLKDNLECPCCECILEHLEEIMEYSSYQQQRNSYNTIMMLTELHEDDEYINCLGLCKLKS